MTVFRRGARWSYDFRHRGQRHWASGFPTAGVAREAEAVARGRLLDQRLAREYGLRPPRARVPTLQAWIADYLARRAPLLAPHTQVVERSILGQFTRACGSLSLLDLDARRLTAYRDRRIKAVSGNQVRDEFARIRSCLGAAVREGYLTANPAKGLEMPRPLPLPDRILAPAEEGRLLAAVHRPLHRDMVALMLWTGLRRGEVCALLGRDVDLEAGRLQLIQPKTRHRLLLPLLPEAVAILRRHVAAPEAPVFRARAGHPVLPVKLSGAFKAAWGAARLPRIRLHDLRHTVAVRLLRAGADLPTVGAILGHKPPYKTTLRYVAHTTEARKREAMAGLRVRKNSNVGSGSHRKR